MNSCDTIRYLKAVLASKTNPVHSQGFALAGKSTLNRLELTPVGTNTGLDRSVIPVPRSSLRFRTRATGI